MVIKEYKSTHREEQVLLKDNQYEFHKGEYYIANF